MEARRRARVIAVLGGGIAGAAVLYELAQRGLAAVLYDDGDAVSGGASGVPVALLNPYRGKRALPLPADLAGLQRFLALAAELGASALGWHEVGVLRIADSAERARAWRGLAGVRWIEPEEIERCAGRSLAAPHGGFLFERGGFVATRVLREALLARAVERGAAVRVRDAVLALELEERTVAVRSARGVERFAAIVSCTGAAPAPWAKSADLRRVEGEVLGWRREELGAAGSFRGPEPVLIARCLLIRSPDEVWVGGAHGGERAEEHDHAAMLRASASALWPELRAVAPRSVFRAARAATPSNEPRVRRVAARLWAVEGLAGRG
jgi:tRNA 5-methylaminomethyl-2-thiouridine biosynthesis bifunctional protein